ncbi:substrate-binding domain-containing protein [Haloflavibacter putidus]|uniref:ABC transporter substrate-binding protein n=1 Tax=Haloflavibacter putidus TaxID=2576776 RepID=A0A507ZS85_9FLAO|nr:substrate-binding domain-containing protein [Haloflavibacter putidus]TQD40229.1 ABC transporter substrate-binding protein [Haloflavibacter putidus]
MKTITIGGVPEHFNYPWHLAIKNNLFKEQGINLVWKDFPGGTGQMSQALENKEIDLAVILTEGVIKKINEGKDFKILQKFIGSPLIWGVHVAANSAYHNLDELENTTAAISRYGSGSHLLAYVNAKEQNWDTGALDFKVINNLDGALEALPNNEAQYFMWERFTTKPFVDKGIFRKVADVPTPWPCFVLATRENYYKNNIASVSTLLKIINSVTKELKSRENLTKEIAEKYNLELEDVNQWLRLTSWSQEQISKDEVKDTQNQLKDLGLIGEKMSYEELI